MIKSDLSGVSNATSREALQDKLTISFSLFLPIIGIVLALLLAIVFGTDSPSIYLAITVAMGLLLALFFRQNELAVMALIAVHLYVDWYLGLHIVSVSAAVLLLFIFFLTRSPEHPWVEPCALWLWALFLVFAIYPAIRGAATLYDTAFYYPNVIFGAFIMFWVGSVLARDYAAIRRFFKICAAFGTLIAIHTIILSTTGTFLFASSHYDAFLASVSNYDLLGSGTQRVASFFVDPNWNGTFLATMLFIALGLLVSRSSWLEKVLYLGETFLILPALLFTYSNGAWIGVFGGVVAFVLLVGSARYRLLLSFLIVAAALLLTIYFPDQLNLQLQHAARNEELSLRLGAWQTAIQVIKAYPLMGVGLGLHVYLERADPYRVPAQFAPLAHPHNSYLELGAMGGLPLLFAFIALLSFALWLALRNWALMDERTRPLFGGGIAAIIALSVNSFSINGWTLPPLAATGWLILGILSSPLIARSLKREKANEKSDHRIHSS